jgi:outer membrane protein assembly factor BamB
LIDVETYAYVEKDQLIALDLSDGSLLWSISIPRITSDVVIDANQPILYMVASDGELDAYRAPDQALGSDVQTSALELLWNRELSARGTLTLLPLPEGGVAVSTREKLVGFSSDGNLIWDVDPFSNMIDWKTSNDQLLLTTGGDDSALWSITGSGPPEPITQPGAKAIETNLHYVLYNNEGIHLLPHGASEPELAYALPRAFQYSGNMIALSDGSVIVAHSDIYDPRLIALNPDGSVRWDRSYSAVVPGRPLLLLLDSLPFLLLQDTSTRFGSSALFAIDIDNAELTPVFDGGPVRMYINETWAQAIDDRRILINMWGNSLVMVDTQAALETVTGGDETP